MNILGTLSCLALPALLASPAGAVSPVPAGHEFTYAEARTLPPAELGRRILGPNAPVVDAVEAEWDFLGFALTLLEPAVRRGPVCRRRIHFVGPTPVSGQPGEETTATRFRAGRVDSEDRFGAVGATGNCPGREQGYTSSYELGETQTAAVLSRLAEARRLAAGSGALPFRIHCRTQAGERDRCGRNPRTVLRALTFEDLAWITPVSTDRCNGTAFRYAGSPCVALRAGPRTLFGWEIVLRQAAGERMSWVIGIRADDPAGTLEMEARHILFH